MAENDTTSTPTPPSLPVIACCDPAEQETCCQPAEKAGCCGTDTQATSCGC